jgi:carboxymethylenebutenolidase
MMSKKLQQQLHALDKVAEIKIYPEAGHAFENPNPQSGYRAGDAADGWKRTTAFFAATLKKE